MQESNNFFLQDFVTPPAYTSEDSAHDLTDLEVLLTQYFLSVFFSHFPRFYRPITHPRPPESESAGSLWIISTCKL